jgi:hypothetical protein
LLRRPFDSSAWHLYAKPQWSLVIVADSSLQFFHFMRESDNPLMRESDNPRDFNRSWCGVAADCGADHFPRRRLAASFFGWERKPRRRLCGGGESHPTSGSTRT